MTDPRDGVRDPRDDVRSEKDPKPWDTLMSHEDYWNGPHLDPHEYEFRGSLIHITNGNYFLKYDGSWTHDHTDPNIVKYDDTPEGIEKARDHLEWEEGLRPGFVREYAPQVTRHDYSKKGRGE